MKRFSRIFAVEQPTRRPMGWGDVVAAIAVAVLLYAGVRLALGAPATIKGPEISLSPSALPWYAALSVRRMIAAYALSTIFSLVYGHIAAHKPRAERILLPLLDVLQSVPILSFLPVILLSLSAILPQAFAAELASVVLIFTSQAWNMTFAWYQSLTTIPGELREASTIFHLNGWLRLKTLELPFAAISLIWNSMMSWAGGWFFLMAAEIFTVGHRDFRLPGLGSYLKEAADQGDVHAILWGVSALVLVIVVLDQVVWRPLLAWSDRFKLEMVESDLPHTSWFYDALRVSRLVGWIRKRALRPAIDRLEELLLRRFPMLLESGQSKGERLWARPLLRILLGIGLSYGLYRAGQMLVLVPTTQWKMIGLGIGATLLRVLAALVFALAWTVPVGVAIGNSPRLATWLQPLVQVAASVPATALFPILLLLVLDLPGGLNVAAILLMLAGSQWYLLFNSIAGASSIPQDLKYTTDLLRFSRWERWRTLILPSLFPYIVTGAITATGGAWNASIVAEYVEFAGKTLATTGSGALIAGATAAADYPLLLAATLSMVLAVSLINRLLWRRLYRLAEETFRME